MLETKIIIVKDPEKDIKKIEEAAQIIKSGGTVAFPTETVYGLGANALSASAVAKIFAAKHRPADNPLIVHITKTDELGPLVKKIPSTAKILFEKFSPGPLTVIMPKSGIVPSITTGGLDNVAVRIPSHPTARALIKASGLPIAAPSANLSGSPSPTSARHCIDDLSGGVDCIIDGGECTVGVESTVVGIAEDGVPVILRPGGITPEMIKSAVGEVRIDHAVIAALKQNEHPKSPGTKYLHYAPSCPVYIVRGGDEEVLEYLRAEAKDPKTGLLVYDEDDVAGSCIRIGGKQDYAAQAARLYGALRAMDAAGVKKILARCPEPVGMGLAVYNRLVRSAGFKFIDV